LPVLQALLEPPKLFSMSHKDDTLSRTGRASHIRNELARLYNEQTEFYRNGARAKHTETEIVECEERRQVIRGLFTELDELREGHGAT
jgi:hypothetical protein